MTFSMILLLYFGSTNARPWLLNEASSYFVKSAVMFREPNIPPQEASIIAASIIEGALAPPQATQIADHLSEAFLEYGTIIPGSAALSIVDMASDAYNQVRQSQGFPDYLRYVSSNAQYYNFAAMQSESNGSGFQASLQAALARLQSDAAGRMAISKGLDLANEVKHDAGLDQPRSYAPQHPPPGPNQQPYPPYQNPANPNPYPPNPHQPQSYQPNPYQPGSPNQPYPPQPYPNQPYGPPPQGNQPPPNQRPQPSYMPQPYRSQPSPQPPRQGPQPGPPPYQYQPNGYYPPPQNQPTPPRPQQPQPRPQQPGLYA